MASAFLIHSPGTVPPSSSRGWLLLIFWVSAHRHLLREAFLNHSTQLAPTPGTQLLSYQPICFPQGSSHHLFCYEFPWLLSVRSTTTYSPVSLEPLIWPFSRRCLQLVTLAHSQCPKTIFEWVREWRHISGNWGWSSPSPSLALISEKWVSSGRPVSSHC